MRRTDSNPGIEISAGNATDTSSSNQSFAGCIELAERMRRLGRFADIIPPLQQAVRLRPQVAEVHYELVRGFFVMRPAGRTHLEVQVLYRPDRGND